MALDKAPNAIRIGQPAVGRDTRFTRDVHTALEETWRQVVAGFVVVPCIATGTDVITLTPRLHMEGAANYGDHMVFAAVAENTSTGAVTAFVESATNTLSTVKVYKDAGAAQAGAGDIVAAGLYLFIFNSALDSGAGGLVLK